MASLKELKTKINVIESTRKVTSAMKLVAGVKLRKAEQKTLVSREYSQELNGMLSKIKRKFLDAGHELFLGRKYVENELLVVFGSDRGLCGNFNYVMGKKMQEIVKQLHDNGKKVKILCVGSKLFEICKRFRQEQDSVELVNNFYKTADLRKNSTDLANKITSYFHKKIIDKASIIYTKYYSIMNRKVETKDIIPILCELSEDKTVTVFEPSAEKILNELLPYNIAIQIYQSALESIASEQSSRMTSMDSATRNADSLLSEFKIRYNRNRQLKITQELVEVISGAKAISKG